MEFMKGLFVGTFVGAGLTFFALLLAILMELKKEKTKAAPRTMDGKRHGG